MKTCANHVTITIDGAAGSGKSTLGQFIAQALQASGMDVRLYEHADRRRMPQPITGAGLSGSKFISVVVRQSP